MKIYLKERIRELEESISAYESEPDPMKRLALTIELTRRSVQEAFYDANFDEDFRRREIAQLIFNKHQFPPLLSKLLFFQKYYDLECFTFSSTEEERSKFIANQLQEIRQFFVENKTFIQYYFSQDMDRDTELFAESNNVVAASMKVEEEFLHLINPGCLLAAYLLAYQKYAVVLRRALNGDSLEPAGVNTVTYKGKIIDLIELGLGLWISEDIHVNGKRATQEFIRTSLERIFGISLSYWPIGVQDIKKRKKDRLSKHNAIIRDLSSHLDKLPEDKPRKKTA